MAKTKPHQSSAPNLDVLFGINPVLEKIKVSPQDIEEILIAEGSDRGAVRRIRQEAQRSGVRVQTIDGRTLSRLTGVGRHQGVAARVKSYAYFSFEDLLENAATSQVRVWVLVLDGVTDPRNFGALLRTAEAVGIQYIIIPKDRSVEVTPTVIKASAGAAHLLKVVKVTNLRRALTDLKDRGFWTAALEAGSGESIYDRTYPARLAIVLGGEDTGVRPINLRECDISVSIPMLGRIGSLNVSVAGAIFLYELVRQSRGSVR